MRPRGGWSREDLLLLAAESGHRPLDLSLGVPADPAPVADRGVVAARTAAYPPSRGTEELRAAAAGYLLRRYGVAVPADSVAACAGSKEFISTLPLFLRDAPAATHGGSHRDTVLIPSLGYPPYELGIRLAGLRPHRVPVDAEFRMRLDLLPPKVVARALFLWINSPANPTGVVEPLAPVVAWGRAHGVLVVSDEAYAEATWCDEPRTVLAHGLDGVLAVHSVSKRSNGPGLRLGFYAGDPRLVAHLVPRRREAGLMASQASQTTGARLFADDHHALAQRRRNARRVAVLVAELNANGLSCAAPEGGLFVWAVAPGGDGTAFAGAAAARAGIVLAPGAAYGPAGAGHVRIAAVHDRAVLAPRLALLDRLLLGEQAASH
ncbi:aminotransferase class I/II-fold pyridoxal phosphate-dependent enzyme [Streptomyces sp. NPDC020800]|uniref:aminotransferase class I/II-fold pyridoxal phosphate-dependent enzyme n=1 Tax=Streptomyces sp. NPDC020800 TaxID=3365092 RepID=UPI0037A1EE52